MSLSSSDGESVTSTYSAAQQPAEAEQEQPERQAEPQPAEPQLAEPAEPQPATRTSKRPKMPRKLFTL
jgi:hypothetical protein